MLKGYPKGDVEQEVAHCRADLAADAAVGVADAAEAVAEQHHREGLLALSDGRMLHAGWEHLSRENFSAEEDVLLRPGPYHVAVYEALSAQAVRDANNDRP